MTLKHHQQLIKLIESISERIPESKQKDRLLYAQAVGFLIELQVRQSQEVE